ncbi:unnamed protein product [Prunus armeniaca]|uniref:Protein kinase domain-containing protein n=1 Tax=Prunus armeniaca TaxID=36596 RepID=A0A6J5TKB9_PRUAR|nr:unnamed protein product [Prunus armeniaca]
MYPLVEQGSLRDILARNNVTFSWDNQISIALQVARGLVFLHGVPMSFIPCFKDANILIGRDCNVKLSGFALSTSFQYAFCFSHVVEFLGQVLPTLRIIDVVV